MTDQPNRAVREEEVRLPALDGEIIQPDRWWQTATPGDIIRLCLEHNSAIARIQSLEQELAKGKVTWRMDWQASDRKTWMPTQEQSEKFDLNRCDTGVRLVRTVRFEEVIEEKGRIGE